MLQNRLGSRQGRHVFVSQQSVISEALEPRTNHLPTAREVEEGGCGRRNRHVGTEATDTVGTEATDTVGTEATDTVGTEATHTVETEATDTVGTEAQTQWGLRHRHSGD